jgi:peptidoglycan-associated lipoprotein
LTSNQYGVTLMASSVRGVPPKFTRARRKEACMSTDRFLRHLAVLGLAAGVAACHHAVQQATVTPRQEPARAAAAPPRPPAPAPPPRAAAAPAPPRALTEDEIFGRESLDALNASHPLGDAFFDYDQKALRDDARAALSRDAQWLNRWSSTRITVQGQADERGSAEYNLALGDERAKAVKNYLASLGVPEARIAVVSLGKEQPVCRDENESCWQQNRRGHFVITSK